METFDDHVISWCRTFSTVSTLELTVQAFKAKYDLNDLEEWTDEIEMRMDSEFGTLEELYMKQIESDDSMDSDDDFSDFDDSNDVSDTFMGTLTKDDIIDLLQ